MDYFEEKNGSDQKKNYLTNISKIIFFDFYSSVVSLNSQKQVIYEATSGTQSVTLNRNATHEMLKIDKTKATFPLILSFNFAVTSPLTEDFEEDFPQVENVT